MELAFIRFLEGEGLLEFSRFDFDTRFRIQKYSRIAMAFGLDMGHVYNMYLYGPYSRSLARSYYRLAEGGAEARDDPRQLPESFDKAAFLSMVDGKSDDWLEIAATAIDRRDDPERGEDLAVVVKRMKSGFDGGYIDSVMGEMRGHVEL